MPYGEEILPDAQRRTEVLGYKSDNTSQTFTSKERDGETGLDYFLARYYSKLIGRFVSPDPIFITPERQLNPQMLNLYGYCINNPLTIADPTGMIPVRLGRSQSKIDSDIADINEQLKQEGLSDEQRSALEQQRKDLLIEKDANIVVSAWLKALEEKGLAKNMKISDFVILTDFKADVKKILIDSGLSENEANLAVFNLTRGPNPTSALEFNGQVYINGSNNSAFGVSRGLMLDPSVASAQFHGASITSSDMIIYGGTILRHERRHQSGGSEVDAYKKQLKILDKFGPKAFSNPQAFQAFRKEITDALANAKKEEKQK